MVTTYDSLFDEDRSALNSEAEAKAEKEAKKSVPSSTSLRQIGPGFSFLINEDLITIKKKREVQRRITEIRKRQVTLMQHIPMNTNESVYEWEIRATRESKEQGLNLPDRSLPKKDEPVDDYLRRYYFDEEDIYELLFELCSVIVEELCPGKSVDKDDVESMPFKPLLKFIVDTLRDCGVKVETLFSGPAWPV